MTQKLYPLIFWKFYSDCRYVGETPRIINKMTNFWRLVFPSIIWLLATLCDVVMKIRENQWLLRLISSFSESVSEYESVYLNMNLHKKRCKKNSKYDKNNFRLVNVLSNYLKFYENLLCKQIPDSVNRISSYYNIIF